MATVGKFKRPTNDANRRWWPQSDASREPDKARARSKSLLDTKAAPYHGPRKLVGNKELVIKGPTLFPLRWDRHPTATHARFGG
jgi:hypothetical protein